MTKFNFLTALFVCSVMLFTACNDDISIPAEIVVYQNSFEVEADTVGWKNKENLKVVNDAAPNYGGNYSLYVRSHVLSQPATSFGFSTDKANDKFKFVISGKMEDTLENAFVKFEPAVGESGDAVSIEIKGSGWNDYATEKTFLVPTSGKFRFTVYTSSKHNAGVNLDKFAIIRIN